MKRNVLLLMASICYWGITSSTTFADATMGHFLEMQSLRQLGERAFAKRCSGCHGVKGDAVGASPLLNPKPRNLTSGVFKFRSTANGLLPTENDLLRTITQGVPGTSMPSFRLIPESERLGLVEYMKSLTPVWADESMKDRPMALPEPSKDLFTKKNVFLASAAKGRDVFKESCLLCHGRDGRGTGASAENLVDEWGDPIKPSDLTKPFIKSGYDVRDIYRVLATGLNGTPMAAFAEALGEEKTWQVVSYIMYLRGETAGLYPAGTIPKIE